MSTFQHVSAFISLILGLGVANVLANFAMLRKGGAAVRWYHLHVAWGALLLVMMALEWWIMLNWTSTQVAARFTFFHFAFMLVKPSLLFFASDMLFPEQAVRGADLREHFYASRRGIFLTLGYYGTADFADTMLKGWDYLLGLGLTYFIANGTITIGAYLAAFTRSERYHVMYFIIVVILITAAVLNVPVAGNP